MSGKGSDRRPRSRYCSDEELRKRWDSIFYKKEEKDTSLCDCHDGACTCNETGRCGCYKHGYQEGDE